MMLLIEMIRRFVEFILIRSAALPVSEKAALTNRKKYKALQANSVTIFLTGRKCMPKLQKQKF